MRSWQVRHWERFVKAFTGFTASHFAHRKFTSQVHALPGSHTLRGPTSSVLLLSCRAHDPAPMPPHPPPPRCVASASAVQRHNSTRGYACAVSGIASKPYA